MGNGAWVHQLQALPFSQLLPPAQRRLGALLLRLRRRGRQGLQRSCLLLRTCACADTQVSRPPTLGEILKLPAGQNKAAQALFLSSGAPFSREILPHILTNMQYRARGNCSAGFSRGRQVTQLAAGLCS